jgi:hypothetical protein
LARFSKPPMLLMPPGRCGASSVSRPTQKGPVPGGDAAGDGPADPGGGHDVRPLVRRGAQPEAAEGSRCRCADCRRRFRTSASYPARESARAVSGPTRVSRAGRGRDRRVAMDAPASIGMRPTGASCRGPTKARFPNPGRPRTASIAVLPDYGRPLSQDHRGARPRRAGPCHAAPRGTQKPGASSRAY